MKTCSMCKINKENIEFYSDNSRKDKLKRYCKICFKMYLKNRFDNKVGQKDKIVKRAIKYRKNLRKEVIEKYGGKCVCCGESQSNFLAIDHKNNNGAKHRREIGIKGGAQFYSWMKRNNWPKEFQLLCHNCNVAKGLYGACPHEKDKENFDYYGIMRK